MRTPTRILAAALTAALSLGLVATSANAATHKATGVVKSVDAKNSTVVLAHEPVASMKWPAMTMTFKADDPKLVQGLTTGQKVNFEFTQRGKDYVLTSIK